MLFRPNLAQLIIEGKKTQTRRVVKPGQYQRRDGVTEDSPELQIVQVAYTPDGWVGTNARVVWNLGSSYAVQPGRGKPTIQYASLRTMEGTLNKIVTENDGDLMWSLAKPARIKITKIRREDVRNITEEDAKAEGFSSRLHFLSTWCDINETSVKFAWHEQNEQWSMWITRGIGLVPGWHHFNDEQAMEVLKLRPGKFYDAWVLNFELVK